MDEIGSLLMTTRESSGVSLEEASKDINIKEEILSNIESGNIGCFKDIFVLKEHLKNYAKYLGLDENKIIDEFNDYMFEYTSKIPIKEIEQQIKEKEKEEQKEEKIISPYTMETKKHNKSIYVISYLILIILIFIIFMWSIKQLTVNNVSTSEISYVKE